MDLTHIVREEMDLTQWKHAPDLVERVLKRLNHLHKHAIQKVLALENQIREAGGEPNVKVSVRWPKPPKPPEPPIEEVLS